MYTCPMHREIKQNKKGRCPKCGMDLVLEKDVKAPSSENNIQYTYKPLIIIIFLIALVTFSLALKDYYQNTFSVSSAMMNFMAGFFLVFSGFKLVDIKGFAQGYSTYDLLAERIFYYGYIYPFLELLLGLSFLLRFNLQIVNVFTFVLMSFSGFGILLNILQGKKFQCACLGTFLKVPLTKITLVEDFGMAFSALLMVIPQILR